MTTLIKFIVATILSISLFSCNYNFNTNMGAKGNGNVTTETRNINESFSSIKATQGIAVYLTQSNNESITVITDENLQEHILIDIEDDVLKIYTQNHISKATIKKVEISFNNISNIISTSGSHVFSTNTIDTESLNLKTTSGSSMKLDVSTNYLNCASSSGSSLKLSGKTINLKTESSSGSSIKAQDLNAEYTNAKASSGSQTTLNTSKELTANTSSGAHIKYIGNPDKVRKNNSTSSRIEQI